MRVLNRLLLTGLLAISPLYAIAAEDAPAADPDVTIRQDGDKTCKYLLHAFLPFRDLSDSGLYISFSNARNRFSNARY